MNTATLICSCGECYACARRDKISIDHLSEDEFIFYFGKGAWLNRSRVKPQKVKSPEEEIEWSKFWNETLWKVKENRKDYELHWNELTK